MFRRDSLQFEVVFEYYQKKYLAMDDACLEYSVCMFLKNHANSCSYALPWSRHQEETRSLLNVTVVFTKSGHSSR